MRVAYSFRGQLSYADVRCSEDNARPTESPVASVARSLKRRLGADVALWWHDRGDDSIFREVWTAKWYDAKTETCQEAEVKL